MVHCGLRGLAPHPRCIPVCVYTRTAVIYSSFLGCRGQGAGSWDYVGSLGAHMAVGKVQRQREGRGSRMEGLNGHAGSRPCRG